MENVSLFFMQNTTYSQVKDSPKLSCQKTDLRSWGENRKKLDKFELQKKPQYLAAFTKTAGQQQQTHKNKKKKIQENWE